MTTLGFDAVTVLLLIAGLIGGVLKALVTTHQPFASRQTIADVATSGAVGILLPASGMLPDGWKPAWQAALVVIVTYSASDLVTNLLGRFKLIAPPTGRRADDAQRGEPK
jgi:hypothetical protein